MQLHEVSVRRTSDTICLVGHAEIKLARPWRPAGPIELYFEFPAEYQDFVSVSADPFVVAMLVPCMENKEPLEVTPPISPQLHFNLPRIRDIFHRWYPYLPQIEIEGRPRVEQPRSRPNRAATFFSGGVDSFYTLLKYRRYSTLPAPLTHIIFMRGIETNLAYSKGVQDSQRLVEEIATTVGVQCIVGKSNIRTHFPLHWDDYYLGSGLAATALALADGLGYVCIPSAFSYHHMVAHGTTPLVDERYSTEQLQLVHDGAEVTRPEKVARAVEWDGDLFLKYLRVCLDNCGGAYNCGKCYKCVRTAITLRALGLLEQAPTFPNKSNSHWQKVAASDYLAFVDENLDFARKHGDDVELIALLEQVVRKHRRSESLRTFVRNSPLSCLRPLYHYAKEMYQHATKGHSE